jgi:hypothetical protein
MTIAEARNSGAGRSCRVAADAPDSDRKRCECWCVAFSVWLGDVHLFAPGGLRLTGGGMALRWAAGYSRGTDVEVVVCDGPTPIATFRDGRRTDRQPFRLPAMDETVTVRDARPEVARRV